MVDGKQQYCGVLSVGKSAAGDEQVVDNGLGHPGSAVAIAGQRDRFLWGDALAGIAYFQFRHGDLPF